MIPITMTFDVPPRISGGLLTGRYELVGGVVRHAKTKQVVMWLRQIGTQEGKIAILPALLPSIGAASSVLTLGVSAAGFTVVIHRFQALEQRLQDAQAVLARVGWKLDLNNYTNFRAALDLAHNAVSMSDAANRRVSALHAINRFVEARYTYTALADAEIAARSQVVDEYLATLSLAYLAEARCYLALEEIASAHNVLTQGVAALRPRITHHVETLLTTNPAAYLHPSLKGQIDLQRLTAVLRWLDPTMDASAVFESQRENIFTLVQNVQPWIDALPPALAMPKQQGAFVKRLVKQPRSVIAAFAKAPPDNPVEQPKETVYTRLVPAMETMESLIEDMQRFESYLIEVQSIQQLGMRFQDWQQLTDAASTTEHSMAYLITFDATDPCLNRTLSHTSLCPRLNLSTDTAQRCVAAAVHSDDSIFTPRQLCHTQTQERHHQGCRVIRCMPQRPCQRCLMLRRPHGSKSPSRPFDPRVQRSIMYEIYKHHRSLLY